MRVGLGTGTTVAYLLEAVARRKPRAVFVASSPRTEVAAQSLGLRVQSFDDVDRLDLAIDGADQIAPDGWLIKGGGGAHTREKIVAASAERFVVIADATKLVSALHAPVPLELSPSAWRRRWSGSKSAKCVSRPGARTAASLRSTTAPSMRSANWPSGSRPRRGSSHTGRSRPSW